MALSYDEVLNVWGRKLLKDRGYTVSADARISVEIEVENSGYGCDSCSYDEAVVTITVLSDNRNERSSVSIDSYRFREILLELVKISANT
jgi:hypothetical protein